mmetsp:Transcript_36614/g.97573  ORF Transcript_36614/g.97573 Transcript_36614/m.97573 type:complete len:330 (-) Transcript_36614:133-1122(-)
MCLASASAAASAKSTIAGPASSVAKRTFRCPVRAVRSLTFASKMPTRSTRSKHRAPKVSKRPTAHGISGTDVANELKGGRLNSPNQPKCAAGSTGSTVFGGGDVAVVLPLTHSEAFSGATASSIGRAAAEDKQRCKRAGRASSPFRTAATIEGSCRCTCRDSAARTSPAKPNTEPLPIFENNPASHSTCKSEVGPGRTCSLPEELLPPLLDDTGTPAAAGTSSAGGSDGSEGGGGTAARGRRLARTCTKASTLSKHRVRLAAKIALGWYFGSYALTKLETSSRTAHAAMTGTVTGVVSTPLPELPGNSRQSSRKHTNVAAKGRSSGRGS